MARYQKYSKIIGATSLAIVALSVLKGGTLRKVLGSLGGPSTVDTSGWVEHQLRNGSGSIKLPPDWSIGDDTLGSVEAHGPGGASIYLGVGGTVAYPGTATSAISTLVAPYCSPEMAITELTPQWYPNENAHIVHAEQLQSMLGGSARMLLFDRSSFKSANVVRVLGYMDCCPAQTYWGYWACFGEAPRNTFAAIAPTFGEIARSWKLNDVAVLQNGQYLLSERQEAYKAFESELRHISDAYDQSNESADRRIRAAL